MRAPFIVLIEDNEGDITLIKEAINKLKIKHELRVFKLPDEALEYFTSLSPEDRSSWPDLILLDFNLPRINGIEILRHLKKDTYIRIIPTIIYSSSEYSKDIQEAYRGYANSYIIKPTDVDEFFEVMESIWNYWFITVKLPSYFNR